MHLSHHFQPLFLLVASVSCVGAIEVGGNAGDGDRGQAMDPRRPSPNPSNEPTPSTPLPVPTSECQGVVGAGPAPVRRLTREELNNTFAYLFKDPSLKTSGPANALVDDGLVGRFESNLRSPVVQNMANDYRQLAEGLAERVTSSNSAALMALAPCAATTTADDACARQVVVSFGGRAFRRPLTTPEVDRYMAFYTGARGRGHTFTGGLRLVVTAMFQSPHFLYHVEKGEPAAAGAKTVPLAPHELAARLSYSLWKEPDETLFTAAANGKLKTEADVEREARRMVTADAGRKTMVGFYRSLLQLGKLDKLTKSTTVFPTFSDKLGPDMRIETEKFVDEVVWRADGKLATLLTAPFSFVNSRLAALYGRNDVTSSSTFSKVDLDRTQRGGLLTQPGFLAARAYSDSTDPVHRGLFVRENLFCQLTPSPDPALAAEIVAPPPDPKLTTRQRYAKHLEDGRCSGCHRLINPIGLGMENYDAIGSYRRTENGQAIDASGEIAAAPDSNGPFNDLVELSAILARSTAVRDCFTAQWTAFTLGRYPGAEETCALRSVQAAFVSSGGDLRELPVFIARSHAFRYRLAPLAGEVCK